MGRAIRKRLASVRKGAIYEGLVATRCGNLHQSTSGTKTIMARSSHKAVTDISKLKIVTQNYIILRSNGDETGPGGTATVTASVEYPSGVFSQILFGGQVQGAMAANTLLESDYVRPAALIPKGATFWIRQFVVNSIAMLYSDGSQARCMNADTTMGDIFWFNTTPTDKTMGGTITQENAGKYCLPPGAIIGPSNAPTVICTGDSITAGLNESASITDMRLGLVGRGFPADTLAFLNHGAPSAKAAGVNSYIPWVPNRKLLWKYATHFIDELGYNDIIYGAATSAATKAALQTNIWSLYPPRAVIIRTTLTPKSTDAIDAFATTANQTTSANNSVRVSFNTDVRAGLPGVRAYWETAWTVEDAHDNGKWISDGTANKYTVDGDHPQGSVGNGLTGGAVNMADIFYP